MSREASRRRSSQRSERQAAATGRITLNLVVAWIESRCWPEQCCRRAAATPPRQQRELRAISASLALKDQLSARARISPTMPVLASA